MKNLFLRFIFLLKSILRIRFFLLDLFILIKMLVSEFHCKIIKLNFNWSIFIRWFLVFYIWISMLFHKITLLFQVILSNLFRRCFFTIIYFIILSAFQFLIHNLWWRLQSIIFTWLLNHFTLSYSFTFLKFVIFFVIIFLNCIYRC